MQAEAGAFAVAALLAAAVAALLRLPTKPGRGPVERVVPRIGGFAIALSFLAAPLAVAGFSEEARRFVNDDVDAYLALLACGGLVFLVGAIDDFRDLSWKVKFGSQAVAAVGIWMAGFRISELTLPTGTVVPLGPADLPLSVFWIVLVTNAMNLIDGRDGVAAGVALLASATLTYIAWDLGHDLIAILFAALAGACFGFLPFNLPRARRFLGDSGAYFLGFSMAALSLAGFVDSTGRVPLYIPVAALGLPILDTGIAFLRRFLDRRNPFLPDQDHVHDRLEARLGSPGRVVLAVYLITAAFSASALGLHFWYKAVGSAVVGTVTLGLVVLLVLSLGYGSTLWRAQRVVEWRSRKPAVRQPPPL